MRTFRLIIKVEWTFYGVKYIFQEGPKTVANLDLEKKSPITVIYNHYESQLETKF